MKFFNAITMNPSLKTDTADLFASCQILATFYTSLIAYFGYKIIALSDCSNKTKLLVSSFIILFPRLIQLSGQLNNDVLATLYVFISMYYIYKWYKNEDKKILDFVLGGFFLGLAMACKLSAVTVAIGYVVIFLIEFIKSIKKKEHCVKLSTLILQYSLFIVICAPIGLWFQFYSHYVYKLPYNFVYRVLGGDLYTGTRAHVLANSDIYNISAFDNTNSGLVYTNGFVNFLVRYVIPFYPKDFAQSFIYCNSRTTFNILTYALKSAIFGEFSFFRGE